MKIIIPMAGMGKRMRPHTLTTPKPLLDIAGKSIVERLIIDTSQMVNDKVEEVAFIIGNFGSEVEQQLCEIANNLHIPSKIYYQYEALGTAHAIYMAKESLNGNVLVAYADTLFDTSFVIDSAEDAYIWVKQIDNPSQFGVVIHDNDQYIIRFAEKPKEFVSDLAIIGIYYFREAEILKAEIEYLLDNKITGNGEYQLTDALENMMKKNVRIKIAKVDGWFDCGNFKATVDTNSEILKSGKFKTKPLSPSQLINSRIIEPCFFGENVKLINSEIGPFVSIGNNTIIENSKVSNSIIYHHSHLLNASVDNSMIGSYVKYYNNKDNQLSLGDFSEIL